MQEAFPVVTPNAAAQLHQCLTELGRESGGARWAEQLLGRVVEREWGTANFVRFNDRVGGGWLYDLSDYLDGTVLHAIVRPGPGGSRTLDEVKEELDAGAAEQSPSRPPRAADDDEGIDVEVEEEGPRAAARGSAAIAADPNDPFLVRVVTDGKGEKVITTVRGNVPGLVAQLLRVGVELNPPGAPGKRAAHGELVPVTEDQIEIWSSMSKPKVQITF